MYEANHTAQQTLPNTLLLIFVHYLHSCDVEVKFSYSSKNSVVDMAFGMASLYSAKSKVIAP